MTAVSLGGKLLSQTDSLLLGFGLRPWHFFSQDISLLNHMCKT